PGRSVVFHGARRGALGSATARAEDSLGHAVFGADTARTAVAPEGPVGVHVHRAPIGGGEEVRDGPEPRGAPPGGRGGGPRGGVGCGPSPWTEGLLGGPTREGPARWSTDLERIQVRTDVASGLVDGVAAELLDDGLCQDQRHHRLGNHTGGWYRSDVAALVVG